LCRPARKSASASSYNLSRCTLARTTEFKLIRFFRMLNIERWAALGGHLGEPGSSTVFTLRGYDQVCEHSQSRLSAVQVPYGQLIAVPPRPPVACLCKQVLML
jgi:hypothetical protein